MTEDNITYLVSNIEWDSEGEDVDLPEEMLVEVPSSYDDYAYNYISDHITSITGWTHRAFTFYINEENTIKELSNV